MRKLVIANAHLLAEANRRLERLARESLAEVFDAATAEKLLGIPCTKIILGKMLRIYSTKGSQDLAVAARALPGSADGFFQTLIEITPTYARPKSGESLTWTDSKIDISLEVTPGIIRRVFELFSQTLGNGFPGLDSQAAFAEDVTNALQSAIDANNGT